MPHALLSASGAEKWYNCTPSARLEEHMPNISTTYAQEGTLAHEFAQTINDYNFKKIKKKACTNKIDELKKDGLYNPEMDGYIEAFAAYVREQYALAIKRSKDAKAMTECRLDFSEYVPEGFGTGDIVIISEGYMNIIDLKYGKNVPVSAENNKQLMLYALGALYEFDIQYGIETVKMTIHQPRLDSISEWEMSAAELYEWAEKELRPKAKLAFAGDGETNPGKHCGFCRVNATCRARAEENLKMAKFDFQEPALLTDDEMSEILHKASELQKWAKDVHDYAYEQAVNHDKKWPGLKLVEGCSNRIYANEEAVKGMLNEHGFDEGEICNTKLKGITEMEKLLGKTRFKDILGEYIVKPAGKPVLVPEEGFII